MVSIDIPVSGPTLAGSQNLPALKVSATQGLARVVSLWPEHSYCSFHLLVDGSPAINMAASKKIARSDKESLCAAAEATKNSEGLLWWRELEGGTIKFAPIKSSELVQVKNWVAQFDERKILSTLKAPEWKEPAQGAHRGIFQRLIARIRTRQGAQPISPEAPQQSASTI